MRWTPHSSAFDSIARDYRLPRFILRLRGGCSGRSAGRWRLERWIGAGYPRSSLWYLGDLFFCSFLGVGARTWSLLRFTTTPDLRPPSTCWLRVLDEAALLRPGGLPMGSSCCSTSNGS